MIVPFNIKTPFIDDFFQLTLIDCHKVIYIYIKMTRTHVTKGKSYFHQQPME